MIGYVSTVEQNFIDIMETMNILLSTKVMKIAQDQANLKMRILLIIIHNMNPEKELLLMDAQLQQKKNRSLES